jgi:hypothetical protein
VIFVCLLAVLVAVQRGNPHAIRNVAFSDMLGYARAGSLAKIVIEHDALNLTLKDGSQARTVPHRCGASAATAQ